MKLSVIFGWIQQHVVATIVVSVVVIGGTVAIPVILLDGKDVSKEDGKQPEVVQSVMLKEELNFEINSEISLLSLVSEDNKVKILSEDKLIDTSTLGEKEISIKYLSEEQEKEEIFKVSIVDTTAPTIQFQKELSTTVGDKIDLLKDVKAIDNSKEDIKVTIEGEYSFNKEGTYNLKYVAIDSSNNKIEEKFTLKVNKKVNSSSTNMPKEPSGNTNNNEKPKEEPPVKEEPPAKIDDPLAKYCDNNIAGYKRNDAGVCTDISSGDSCKYQPCFGGDMPMREYFETDEEYNTALNRWIENNHKQAKEICTEKGLGWKQVEWDPYFGDCTWN